MDIDANIEQIYEILELIDNRITRLQSSVHDLYEYKDGEFTEKLNALDGRIDDIEKQYAV